MKHFDVRALCLLMVIPGLMIPSASLLAFHDGGVGSCSACHTMHNSDHGFPVNPTAVNNYLLRTDFSSELCLSCHETENGAVWSLTPFTPAPERGSGNFVFASATNLNDAPDGFQFPLSGSHGVHNCVAPSLNCWPDPAHSLSPGGTYPSSELGCTSCHDPHGNSNFRMLRGTGAVPAGNFNFIYPAPLAEGIPLDGPSESRALHTAYKSGWTNWCRNCHGLYHDHTGTGFEHPVDRAMGNEIAVSYGLYDGSANPRGGNPLISYLPELPYQDPSMTPTGTSGPNGSGRIACITCHRAHGSSAVDLGRWDFRVLNLRLDGTISGSYALPVPYNGTIERQLCVKCHERDTRDHGLNQACIECHRAGDRAKKSEHLPMKKFQKR